MENEKKQVFEVYPETPQQKKERLELEYLEKLSNLKKKFIIKEGKETLKQREERTEEGLDEVADYLIKKLNLKERTISNQKIGAEIEIILEEKSTSRNIREIIGKIGRKIYNTQQSVTLQPLTAEEFVKKDIPEEKYLLKPLIPRNGITILAGQPGIGKSWLLLAISKAITYNNKLFGELETTKAKVLLIDEESTEWEIQRRLKLMKVNNSDFGLMVQKGIKLDNENQVKELVNFVKGKYNLIIFDSLRAVHNSDENNSQETQILIDSFREFTREGITVLICHHHRKESFLNSKDPNQVLRGSSALLAGIDSLISVEGQEKNRKTIEFNIIHAKLRTGRKIAPFKVILEGEDEIHFIYKGQIEDEISQREKAKRIIKEILAEGDKYRKEIINLLFRENISLPTSNRAIKEMKESEEIISVASEGRKVYLHLNQ